MLGKKTILSLISTGILGLVSFSYAQTRTIDDVILENAAKSQVVMFGEFHYRVIENQYLFIEDCLYVISLLPKLKEMGHNKLALEIDSYYQGLMDSYSRREIDEYALLNQIGNEEIVELIVAGRHFGMDVYAIDERPVGKAQPREGPPSEYGTDRNQKMFENMKRMIFDKDPKARVVVFIGAHHINEKPVPHPCTPGIHKTLGYFISEYVGEDKNYTVNLGVSSHPYVDLDINKNQELFKKLNRGRYDIIIEDDSP